jgi:hypothetical protein
MIGFAKSFGGQYPVHIEPAIGGEIRRQFSIVLSTVDRKAECRGC